MRLMSSHRGCVAVVEAWERGSCRPTEVVWLWWRLGMRLMSSHRGCVAVVEAWNEAHVVPQRLFAGRCVREREGERGREGEGM